jgi:hypothetical protein
MMKQKAIKKAGYFLGILSCFTLSSITSVASAADHMLLPPWYLLKNQLSASLDADPCVHVEDLTGEGLDMEIKVSVCNEDKAQALAAFINRTHEFGDNLAVKVTVYSSDSAPVEAIKPGNLKETVDLVNRALKGNHYFVKAKIGVMHDAEAAYAIFKPKVIQYYSDDIGDWYLNANEVAAKVFGEVFNFDPYAPDAVKLYPTTSVIKKNTVK